MTRAVWEWLFWAALAVVLAAVFQSARAALYSPVFLSGWMLAGLIVFLSAFGLRRRMPVAPLGEGSTWMRAHIGAGLLALAVFPAHAGAPDTPMEFILWALFALTAASGVVGLFLCRVLPSRIRARGGGHPPDDIPRLRAQAARRARELAASALALPRRQSLARFYAARLHPFFAGPRNLFSHLAFSTAPARALTRELDDVAQYLGEDGRETVREFRELVEWKDALDFQNAMRLALRGWLFIHLPATGALLIFSAVHIAAAYGFSLGTR